MNRAREQIQRQYLTDRLGSIVDGDQVLNVDKGGCGGGCAWLSCK